MVNPLALGSVATAALHDGASSIASAAGTAVHSGASETPFAGVLQDAFQQMGKLEADAASKVDGVLQGTGVDVHAAMIATERSDLAFETALAVRSKAVSAYEQLNSMQF
jgi:flagellar hook-basal body complex protein FliE